MAAPWCIRRTVGSRLTNVNPAYGGAPALPRFQNLGLKQTLETVCSWPTAASARASCTDLKQAPI